MVGDGEIARKRKANELDEKRRVGACKGEGERKKKEETTAGDDDDDAMRQRR